MDELPAGFFPSPRRNPLKRTLSINGIFSQYYGIQRNLSGIREKSKSTQKLTQDDMDIEIRKKKTGFKDYFKKETQELKESLKKEAENAKDAAERTVWGLRSPDSWMHKKLIQKLFPADFSSKVECRVEDFNDVLAPVYIHVYRLKESDMGFYHTGIEIHGREYTFCCDKGIVQHEPRKCDWGEFLGTIMLGEVNLDQTQVDELLADMKRTGFASADYDVMKKSCNTFTEVFSGRLGLLENFPTAVHNQTKLGQILSPVVKALDFAVEVSGNLNTEGSTAAAVDPDSGHASLSLSPSHLPRSLSVKRSSISKLCSETFSSYSGRSSRRTSFLEVPTDTPLSSPSRSGKPFFVPNSSSMSPAASLSSLQSSKYKQN